MSALSLVTAEVAPEVTAGRRPVVRGTLGGDHALVYGLIAPPGPVPGRGWSRPEQPRLELTRWSWPWGACVAILRVALSGGQPELIDLDGMGRRHWPTRRGPAPLRWHLAGGVLYHATCHPVDNSPRAKNQPTVEPLEGPNGTIGGVPLTAPVLAAGRVGPGGEGVDRFPARWTLLRKVRQSLVTLGPVDERFGPVSWPGPPRRPEAELWRTHYDFHPVAPPDQFDLYVSAPIGLYHYHQIPRPDIDPSVRGWGLASTHPPAWVGPFYVCADGADRHFVVPGGRVFSLPADAQPGTALVKTWDGDPVLALVHDADSGKSYAFTRTHYFYVTSKPDPKPHAITAFPGATAEEALDTVAKCGRMIRSIK